MSYYNDFSEAIGVKISSWALSSDNDNITIHGTRDGKNITLAFRVEADCCSYTWIDGVYEESALAGHTIIEVRNVDFPSDFQQDVCANCVSHEYHDSLDFYALSITTTGGRAIVDYRNDSNGCYGGSMNLVVTEDNA